MGDCDDDSNEYSDYLRNSTSFFENPTYSTDAADDFKTIPIIDRKKVEFNVDEDVENRSIFQESEAKYRQQVRKRRSSFTTDFETSVDVKKRVSIMEEQEVGDDDEEEDKDYLFSSISVHFNISRFFWQLFIHLFWPFSIFFSPNMKAQLFTNRNFGAIRGNHIFPFIVLVMLFSYIMMSIFSPPEDFRHFQGSVWNPILFYVLHRATIAVKYASLTEDEYQRFMSAKTDWEVMHYNIQLLLLWAWGKNRDHESMGLQIVSSAVLVGAHLEKLFITVPPPNRDESGVTHLYNWKVLLYGEFITNTRHYFEDIVKQRDGSYLIPLHAVCRGLLRETDAKANIYKYIIRTAYAASILMTAIPFFGFLDYRGNNVRITWPTIYLFSSSIITFHYFYNICLFIFLSIMDVQRNFTAQILSHNLIRLTDYDENVRVYLFSDNSTRGRSAGRDKKFIPEAVPRQTSLRMNENQTKSSMKGISMRSANKLKGGGSTNTGDDGGASLRRPSKQAFHLLKKIKETQQASAAANTPVLVANSSGKYSAAAPISSRNHNSRASIAGRPSDLSLARANTFHRSTGIPLVPLGTATTSPNSPGSTSIGGNNSPVGVGEFKSIPSSAPSTVGATANSNGLAASPSVPAPRFISEWVFTNEDSEHETRCENGDIILPRMSMRYEQNITSWTWLNVIMMNIGKRFTARLDVFTGICLASNFAYMFGALALIFSASNGQNRIDAFKLPIFRQSIVCISIFSVFTIVYTFLAANVNWETGQQAVTLAAHMVRVREYLIDFRARVKSYQQLTATNANAKRTKLRSYEATSDATLSGVNSMDQSTTPLLSSTYAQSEPLISHSPFSTKASAAETNIATSTSSKRPFYFDDAEASSTPPSSTTQLSVVQEEKQVEDTNNTNTIITNDKASPAARFLSTGSNRSSGLLSTGINGIGKATPTAANTSWEHEQTLLAQQAQRIQEERLAAEAAEAIDVAEAEIRSWESVERTIYACLQSIEARRLEKPYYVLGFQARYALTITIASSLASFYLTIISTYYDAQSTASSKNFTGS